MNEETKKVIRTAIVLGIVCLVLLIATESRSILVRGLMIGIACLFLIGAFIMRWPVEVGLLILSLAFLVSWFTGVWIGEAWRLAVILEANPHVYAEYVWDAFLYYVLPPAVGLVFSVIAFVRERKSPTGVLEWWLPLMVFGGFFLFWAVYGVWWTYGEYLETIQWLHQYGKAEIADLIVKARLEVWIAGVLWIFAGVLFMLSPIFKMMVRKKDGKARVDYFGGVSPPSPN
jgi:hypothetical protein